MHTGVYSLTTFQIKITAHKNIVASYCLCISRTGNFKCNVSTESDKITAIKIADGILLR